MIEYIATTCPFTEQEITLFLDHEWTFLGSGSILDMCVCLEGRMPKCERISCRFHRLSVSKDESPFSDEEVRDLLTTQNPKVKPKHRPPERVKHVFDFFGIEARNTPERVALLNDGSGFVYIIKCQDLVKVGIAASVESRLAALQVGNPYTLEVINSFASPEPALDERRLHCRLAKYHVRGEWFGIPDRVLDKLRTLTTLDAIRAYAETGDGEGR
jgi:hypothetical protein